MTASPIAEKAGADTERAIALLSLLNRIPNGSSEEEMLELLFEARDALGVDHAVFASFIRDDTSNDSFRFLVAADAAWCVAYQRKWWFTYDAWLLYASTNSEPVSDTQIELSSDHQKAARELAKNFGLESAYIVPAPSHGGVSRVGVLLLGSNQPGYFDNPTTMGAGLKPLARSLSMELHEWWVRWMRTQILSTSKIGEEELMLLRMERAGEATKEIARKCGMTPAAVDSRFQRLIAKLGTPNRKAAARMAAEYGLI